MVKCQKREILSVNTNLETTSLKACLEVGNSLLAVHIGKYVLSIGRMVKILTVSQPYLLTVLVQLVVLNPSVAETLKPDLSVLLSCLRFINVKHIPGILGHVEQIKTMMLGASPDALEYRFERSSE